MKKLIFTCCCILCAFFLRAQYGGEIPEELVNCQSCVIQCVPTIADLKLVNVSTVANQTYFKVAGYYTSNDGGGGFFVWDAASNVKNDNGYVIERSPNSTGRFLRVKKGQVRLREFGATDNQASTQAFKNAIDYFTNSNASAADIFIDAGIFKISLDFNYEIKLKLFADARAVVMPEDNKNYILKFTEHPLLEHEITGVTFTSSRPSVVPTGLENDFSTAIILDYEGKQRDHGCDIRIDKGTFNLINGVYLKSAFQTYISNSTFFQNSKAVVIRKSCETRIFNCNIKNSGYGVDADGSEYFSGGKSNAYHCGLYLKNSFIMGNTNYPVYCTYMDYADLSNNMIDYNDKPCYFKSLTVGNIHGNFLGTRLNSTNLGQYIESKSLVITGGTLTNFESNYEDRSVQITVSNNYILSHPDNNQEVDAILINNASYLNFSNNHVDYYTGHGLILNNCTESKLNDNHFARKFGAGIPQGGSYGIKSTGFGSNNVCVNNKGVTKEGLMDDPGILDRTVIITEQNIKDIPKSITQGGNDFGTGKEISIGSNNGTGEIVNIINRHPSLGLDAVSLQVSKDYVLSNRDFRLAPGKYLQLLSASGLSTVLGINTLNTDNLLIGGLFGNTPSSISFKTMGNEVFTIGDHYVISNTELRMAQGKYFQLHYPNNTLASVLGGDNQNIYFGNIFNQLPSGGELFLRGNAGVDKLKIGSSVFKKINTSWYNVAVDNYFETFTPTGNTFTIDFSNFNTANIELFANSNLVFSNLTKNKYTIIVKQGSSNFSLNFPSGTYVKGCISQAANSYSVLNIEFDGTNTFVNIASDWTITP